jgi:hypothetical protein
LDYSNPVKRQISKFLFAEWGRFVIQRLYLK